MQLPGVTGAVSSSVFVGEAGKVPQVALQLTPVIALPVTVAFRVTVFPANTVAADGVIVTTTGVDAKDRNEQERNITAIAAIRVNCSIALRITRGRTCSVRTMGVGYLGEI